MAPRVGQAVIVGVRPDGVIEDLQGGLIATVRDVELRQEQCEISVGGLGLQRGVGPTDGAVDLARCCVGASGLLRSFGVSGPCGLLGGLRRLQLQVERPRLCL